jgi:hypothetical protein
LFSNLSGLIFYGFTITSHISVTFFFFYNFFFSNYYYWYCKTW